jgi:hypothetical protein
VKRIVLVIAGLLLMASPVVLHRAPAHAQTDPGSGLGGFKISSTATGIEFVYSDGSEVDATIPLAESDFATGIGHALSADFYPGPVGGNPGATIEQFLGADLPSSIITPLSTLQDSAKAEAYSGGPTDSSFPAGGPAGALNDTAHADDASATAVGTLVNAGENVSTRSVTTIGTSSVTTTATSTVGDLSVGGLIHIGTVTSTVTASSDGKTGKASGATTISGFTILGQAIGITSTGLTVGTAKIPLNLSSVLTSALSGAGITVSVSPYDHSVTGAQSVVHAPALSILIANAGTLILGGAEAEADASPAYVTPPLPGSSSATTVAPVVPSFTADSGAAVSTGDDTGATSGSTGDQSTAFAPPATTAPSSGGSTPDRLATRPASSGFGGIGAGLVILGLLVSGAGAFGFGKMPEDVLEDKVTASPCPLDRSAP